MPERRDHLHMMHIPPTVGEEERARLVAEAKRGQKTVNSVPAASAHAGGSKRGVGSGGSEQIFKDRVGQQVHSPNLLRAETLPK